MDKYKFTLGYGGYKCDAAGNQSGEFYFADEVDELLAQLSALRSPAPAAPKCVYCGSPMPKGEIRCQVCHPDEKPAPAPVTGWRPEWGLLNPGDVIQYGDEYYIDDEGEWRQHLAAVGEKVVKGDCVRRRLPARARG